MRNESVSSILPSQILAGLLMLSIALTGCGPADAEDNNEAPVFEPIADPMYPTDSCGTSGSELSAANVPEQQVACSSAPTRVMAWHTPLYSPVLHTSVISARAENTTGGLESITIVAIKGKISDCTELGDSASLLPCRKEATVLPPKVCSITDISEPAECELSIDIAGDDMISYVAVAKPLSGPERSTSMITYSGGPTSVEVAIPVWWHTDMPNVSLSDDRINLAIYADAGYSEDLVTFGSDLSGVVSQAFFTKDRPFAEIYTKNRQFFDIWAFPFPGATASENCGRVFSDTSFEIDGLMDGSAILHKSTFPDCSSIGKGGVGSVGAYSEKPAWLLVHESAHFLFGLADEYGEGGQIVASDPPNVFTGVGSCELKASSSSWPSNSQCNKVGSSKDTFRIRTKEPETMKDRFYSSKFRNTAHDAISNQIAKCVSGDCYEGSE